MYGGDFKGGASPLMWVRKGGQPLAAHTNCGFCDPAHAAVKPEIVSVAGANMQWGHFVCPSSSQKRGSAAFDLILQSTWGLSSPGKQVGRSSTLRRKRARFGVEKVNSGQNICNRVTSVGNGKNFEKQAQSSTPLRVKVASCKVFMTD